MLEIIVTSSILIVVIAVLRTVLKGKISLRLQYALWALVALRLLIPAVPISSPVSVMNAVPELSVRAALPSPGQGILPDYTPAGEILHNPAKSPAVTPVQSSASTQITPPVSPYKEPLSVVGILRIVWYAGMGVFAVCFAASNVFFYRKLKRRARPVDILGCPLPVFCAEGLPSPCLFGLFRPAIYLTPESFESEERLGHILAHELTHRRHFDHLWPYVRGLCLTVHWFNPLVWLAAMLSKRDCELACDESTLLCLGEENRIEYGRTLVGMMAVRHTPYDLLCGATTMNGGKRGIKERILLIARRPKMLAYTLVAVLLVMAVTVGCTFTGASGEQEADTPPSTTGQDDNPKAPEIRFEAEGDIPESVREYALEQAKQELTYYTNDCGYIFTDAKITALTKIEIVTAGLGDDVQLWLLEYRFLPEDQDSIMLAGGMEFDGDGWLTERNSAGQPYLLAVYSPNTGEWQEISVVYTDTIETEYGTPDMLAFYGDKYSAAAAVLYNKWRGGYHMALIYDLFDSGGSMDVGLVIKDLGAYNTYTVNERWYAERFNVLMSSYKWEPADQSDSAAFAGLKETAQFYITVDSAGEGTGFTFFGDSDYACYRSGGAVAWYKLTYIYEQYENETYSLAESMRGDYDNLDADCERISFDYSGTPEETARLFTREIYANHMLHLAPGGRYSITDYQVVDWQVLDVSADETAIVGSFEYAVIPENLYSNGLWAGNTGEGEGDLEGWLVMYRQFVLEKQEDGYWRCTGLGTGGYTLPE